MRRIDRKDTVKKNAPVTTAIGAVKRHERTTERGSADLRRGSAALQRTVSLHQLIASDEPYESGLVSHVEEHREYADEKTENEQ